jgi:hypothetical protein
MADLSPIVGVMSAVEGSDTAQPWQRKVRKLSLGRALSEVHKAGETVRAVTIAADGSMTLSLGEPASDNGDTPEKLVELLQ